MVCYELFAVHVDHHGSHVDRSGALFRLKPRWIQTPRSDLDAIGQGSHWSRLAVDHEDKRVSNTHSGLILG